MIDSAPTSQSIVDESSADSLLGKRELYIRSAVRSVVEKDIAPKATELDASEEFASDGYQALAKMDLTRIWAPKELGGTGDSYLSYAVAMEEIAAGCPSTSTIFMTQMHVGHPLAIYASDPLRKRYVPLLAQGGIYGSLAITEPSAGSDAASLTTTAVRDGDQFIINGQKTFITTGTESGVVLLFATLDRTLGPQGITAFCIDSNTPGFSRGKVLKKMGMRGSPTCELFFSDCKIPASNLVGVEGAGWRLLLGAVNKSRLSAAAQGVGIARGAYQMALKWASSRNLLDPKNSSAQAIQFGLSDLRMSVSAARLILYSVAQLLDNDGDDIANQISIAKTVCTDTAVAVSIKAADLLGAEGDRVDLGVERFIRDAKVTQIYDGTNQIQRLLVARGFEAMIIGK